MKQAVASDVMWIGGNSGKALQARYDHEDTLRIDRQVDRKTHKYKYLKLRSHQSEGIVSNPARKEILRAYC